MQGDELKNKSLSRDDLMLLMDSYRNTIQMHTTLVEQQKVVIGLQHELLTKQDSILNKQDVLCRSMESISKNLEGCAERFREATTLVTSKCDELNSQISGKVEGVETKVDRSTLDSVKEHGSLKLRLYIAMGGMILIILSLVTLNITAFEKFEMFQECAVILKQLAEYFNLG